MKAINGEELKNRLDTGEDLVVVEALPEEYYRAGHIPGARHLPLEHLDRRADSVIRDRHAPVIVYCASEACQNSHTAAKRLTELGYRTCRSTRAARQTGSSAGIVWGSRLEGGDGYETTRSRRGAVGRDRTRLSDRQADAYVGRNGPRDRGQYRGSLGPLNACGGHVSAWRTEGLRLVWWWRVFRHDEFFHRDDADSVDFRAGSDSSRVSRSGCSCSGCWHAHRGIRDRDKHDRRGLKQSSSARIFHGLVS